MKNNLIPFTVWIYGLFFIIASIAIVGCAASEAKPVDVFPEDMCSNCRMAISESSFASEIVTNKEVFKFDDLGCLESFQNKHKEVMPLATFVKDYESKTWVAIERSTIVKTNLTTPMGSGKVAFADSVKANAFGKDHPLADAKKSMSCSCCKDSKDKE
ncbi:MAG: nitrous oxide reductase accessory protein NosL [Ignavibacteriales bacterium]|nr:nitrous oxide reductase accessory protein NosL [Ignavibacteriales bacterium]